MSLLEYLTRLNSVDATWGIWVNPQNINDYRIGEIMHENGGMRDNKIFIGNLESLSFGFQSEEDALEHVLVHGVEFKGRLIRCNRKAMKDAFFEKKLHPEFEQHLQQRVDLICEEWAHVEAENFIEQSIPQLLEQAHAEAIA